MSGQSFKQVVEELENINTREIVYRFNSNIPARSKRSSQNPMKRKLPPGWFEEKKFHGDYVA